VFAELNRRICTSTNQTSVNVEPMSDNLTTGKFKCVVCALSRVKHQAVIGKRTWHKSSGTALGY
jgi:hypothetical protein